MEFKQLIDMPYYTKNQVMKMKKDELVESYMFLQGGYQAELDAAWQCVENANKNADAEEHNKQAGIILEENDRLQEELSNLKYDLEELQDNNEYHEAGYYKFKEENDKLKEEIEKLKETNEIRFDKIKEMENEVGVSKLVHHQNMGLLEDNKKLKEEIEKLKSN